MTAGRFERLVVNGGIGISDQKPNRESRAQRIPLNMVPLTFYPFSASRLKTMPVR